MKGGEVQFPNNQLVSQGEPLNNNIPVYNQERLQALGFEEGELEMFFEMRNYTEDQLINRYLEIAQGNPYNLNWESENDAINAPYMLGVFKPHGTEYTKHDIAEDTLSFFYETGGQKKNNKTRKGKTRKGKTRKGKTRKGKTRKGKTRK
jgi:hypothetical protein